MTDNASHPPKVPSATVRGVVVAGHGAASGANDDPRFSGGTLSMQAPHFAASGVDIARFHGGTINLDVAPYRMVLDRPVATLHNVRWHPTEPAEDFSFVDCRIGVTPQRLVSGLVYHPHPETKPEHRQPPTIVEILAPWIEEVAVGAELWLEVSAAQAHFETS